MLPYLSRLHDEFVMTYLSRMLGEFVMPYRSRMLDAFVMPYLSRMLGAFVMPYLCNLHAAVLPLLAANAFFMSLLSRPFDEVSRLTSPGSLTHFTIYMPYLSRLIDGFFKIYLSVSRLFDAFFMSYLSRLFGAFLMQNVETADALEEV